MTEDRKESLIAKLIDAPSSLTDEDLELIVGDDELRDIYEMSTIVKGACMRPSMDVSEEWVNFRPRLTRRPRPAWGWIVRVAAAFFGVSLLAAVVIKFSGPIPADQPLVAAGDEIQETDSTILLLPHDDEDETIAVESPSEQAPPVPVPPKAQKNAVATPEIDIDEYLRIEQARIDEEIAVQMAEIYLSEYNAMQQSTRDVDLPDYENGNTTDDPAFIKVILR